MTDNPRVSAEQYMRKYAVSDLFDYLLAQIVLELPDDPWRRLSEVCESVDNTFSAEDVPFFSKEEIDAVFAKYEVLERGHIMGQQAKHAFRAMGLRQELVDSLFIADEQRVSRDAFYAMASKGLRKRLTMWYGK